jgi:hypothetical protein
LPPGECAAQPIGICSNAACSHTHAFLGYAFRPGAAAGICASFDGGVVEVTINVDVPSPRCAIIRSDQTLTVVNGTPSTVQVSISNFSSNILPGAEYSVDILFGDFLAVGVHQLTVTPYYGPELWLKSK